MCFDGGGYAKCGDGGFGAPVVLDNLINCLSLLALCTAFHCLPWTVQGVPVVLDNLIHSGEIPPTIAVFLSPGRTADYPEQRSLECDKHFWVLVAGWLGGWWLVAGGWCWCHCAMTPLCHDVMCS